MKIGVAVAFNQYTTPEVMVDVARHAEECGFHGLWVPEHVLFFRDYASRYPYADNGRIPGDPDGLLDPFSVLTFIAARTSRIRLGTGICILPQRSPVYTARQVADLDFLSGGRMDFGIGVGWLEEEFRALGVPFSERGARADEALDLMKALWTQEAADFDGKHFQLSKAMLNPKPVQRPHPPILVGGESAPALRRAVTRGDGWYGFDMTEQALSGHLDRLAEALTEAARSREEFRVLIAPRGGVRDTETCERYRTAGVDEMVVPVMGRTADAVRHRLDTLARVSGVSEAA